MFPCERNRPKVADSRQNASIRGKSIWADVEMAPKEKQSMLGIKAHSDRIVETFQTSCSHYLKHELTVKSRTFIRGSADTLAPRCLLDLLRCSSWPPPPPPFSSSTSSCGRRRKGGMWRGGRRREVPPSLCSCSKLSSAGGHYGLREQRALKANIDFLAFDFFLEYNII